MLDRNNLESDLLILTWKTSLFARQTSQKFQRNVGNVHKEFQILIGTAWCWVYTLISGTIHEVRENYQIFFSDSHACFLFDLPGSISRKRTVSFHRPRWNFWKLIVACRKPGLECKEHI